jgi:hypothetical protein
MDQNQVRARIIEVGLAVKKQLLESGLCPEEPEPGSQYKKGDGARRTDPFWSRERGFKYIDDVEDHLRRFFQCLDLLDPRAGSSVFEIGPGNCYFLFMCRELRGCQVAGVEWKQDDASSNKKAQRMPHHDLKKRAYRLFREYFGLEDAIKHQIVEGFKPIDFGRPYDTIVATRAMFNHGWREGEYGFWLRDCYEHLQPEGQLMVHFNKIDPESLAAFPFLLPHCPPRGNEKLSIIPREMIGQTLADKP